MAEQAIDAGGIGARDVEVPEQDAFEQSIPVDDAGDELPLEVLSGDLEVPESDAVEQRLPAAGYDDESWR